MDIKNVANRFAESYRRNVKTVEFPAIPTDRLRVIFKELPKSDDLLTWYSTAAPAEVSIPMAWDPMQIFSPHVLERMQIGYRWEGDGQTRISAWNESWLAIGYIEGDPVIADMQKDVTPILMDLKGAGSWSPSVVAPTLGQFLEFLSEWCDVIGQYSQKDGMYDDEWAIKPTALEDINNRAVEVVGSEYAKNLIKYLFLL